MPTMPTDKQIEAMKLGFEYSLSLGYPYNKKPYKPTHGSNNRIKIAYAWLDAQKKIKHINKRLYFPVKHMVEGWCGDYVSRDDVEIAAALHPEIRGVYPDFNISQLLTLPSKKRLAGIDLQGQGYKNNYEYKYKIFES
jgi:hypothetical protein